jgi:hypothetical protein
MLGPAWLGPAVAVAVGVVVVVASAATWLTPRCWRHDSMGTNLPTMAALIGDGVERLSTAGWRPAVSGRGLPGMWRSPDPLGPLTVGASRVILSSPSLWSAIAGDRASHPILAEGGHGRRAALDTSLRPNHCSTRR